jgi:hypothetical protein
MTLVSIVTPSYNQAAFIEVTLRSVLAQDYPEIEYLVVDGASTDGSPAIIRSYADRLAWWISEPDSGQAEAINKGLRRARGEIVAWLNSDDLYLPGAVNQAVTALQADPSLVFVFGDALSIDSDGRPINHLSFGNWGLSELASFRIICQPAVFMRRDALVNVGWLDPAYHYMLDHHLWLRLARLGPILHIPQLWAAARQHPGAKNVSQAAGFARESFAVLAWMQAQPDLAAWIARHPRQVKAGVYRLQGRYLLDAGQPGAALRAYARALVARPGYVLKHAHRMLYALLLAVGARSLAQRLSEANASRRRLPPLPDLQSWSGLRLNMPDSPEGHHQA